jgi:hypothetical protein
MTSERNGAAIAILLAFAACGNYSNEDLEFMNAVPAREDLTAFIPRSMILPANEAELSKETHSVIATFNGALDFLNAADLIRTYQPTSRIPDGRVWGPAPMNDHPGWQWRFTMTRDPAAPEMFKYTFDVEPIGAGDSWSPFISGSFVALGGGVRRGMGSFTIKTDTLRAAHFPFAYGNDGSLLQELDVMYSTASFPISVSMNLTLYPKASTGDFTTTAFITYHYEAQESGQGGMEFAGTDSASGASLSVVSRWLATGRGRAEATVTSGTGAGATWTECWDDSFRSVYDNKPWAMAPDPVTTGDPALCPDISTL